MKEFIHRWLWLVLLMFCGVGLIYPIIGLTAIVCMLGPSVYAMIQNGRGWCGAYCPRGSFSDVILPRISVKHKIPGFLRSSWFRILFLSALMTAFAVQLFFAWGNTYHMGMVFVRMILLTTALTLILGIIYQPRTWCTFCPMGTMAHYITKWRTPQHSCDYVTFEKDSCSSCQKCNKTCPMRIDVLAHKETGKVTSPDCIKCGMCVNKCPKHTITLKKAS